MYGRERSRKMMKRTSQIRSVEGKKEGDLSVVTCTSTPRERVDLLAVFQSLLIGATGASALMAIGAWVALSLAR